MLARLLGTSKMKILYTNFHPGDGGGHTTYINSLARLMRQQHDVHVAAPAQSRLLRLTGGLPGVGVTAVDFAKGFGAGDLPHLRNLIRAKGFDIVHVNGAADHRLVMCAVSSLGRYRPRIVFTKHNSKSCRSAGNWLRARIATDRAIAVSQHTKRILVDSPYHCRPIDVVYNGIDTDWFSPWPERSSFIRESFGIPHNAFVFGSSAGTAKYKGWMDLLEAVRQLPSHIRERIHILLAGKYPDMPAIARVNELGLTAQVHFCGVLDDVRPLISASDVGFVLSYEVETISFACREMMSMGKPVMVSDYAGLPENIEHGADGWVVRSRDVSAIGALIEKIIADKEALARMGMAARRRAVTQFNQELFARGTERTYAMALGEI